MCRCGWCGPVDGHGGAFVSRMGGLGCACPSWAAWGMCDKHRNFRHNTCDCPQELPTGYTYIYTGWEPPYLITDEEWRETVSASLGCTCACATGPRSLPEVVMATLIVA